LIPGPRVGTSDRHTGAPLVARAVTARDGGQGAGPATRPPLTHRGTAVARPSLEGAETKHLRFIGLHL
jgi:hypothetical protein